MIGKTNAVVGDSTPQYQGSYNITQNGTLATANKKMTQDLVVNVIDDNLEKIIDRTITNYSNDSIVKIGNCAFQNCKLLTDVLFTNATTIEANAFYGCSRLNAATFLKTTYIDRQAFRNSQLKKITLGANQVCQIADTSIFNPSANIIVYVPSNLIEDYKAATNWSTLYNNGRVDFLAITE